VATRNFLKHTVSSSEPTGSALGDEWYNPTNNRIYKRLAVNGSNVEFREIPSALIVESNGITLSQSTNTINFIGYTLTVDGDGTLNVNVPTASVAGSNTQIQFNNSGSLGASSNFTWNNATQTLAITGFLTTFALSRSGNINAPTWTTASPIFNSAASLLTDTNGSGTIAIKAGHSLLSPNFASTNITTITNAANLFVNATVASTNTTITNNWSIYNEGNMRVTGTLFNDAQITAAGTLIRTGSFSRGTFTLGGAVELAAATITDTTGSGTIATKGHIGIGQATFASSNLTTVTDAANLFVAGDVIAGTNTTLSNTWGIYNAGKQRIAGQLVAWNTTTPGLTVGSLHLGAASATANAGSAITFGSRDSSSGSTAQAGIYINSDGGYGTRMYFATTGSYATGSTTGMWLDESGRLRITRNVGSTSTTTGTLIVTGGVGISEILHVGGGVRIEAGTGIATYVAKGGGTSTALDNQYGVLQFADSAFTNKGFIQSKSIDATNTKLDFLVLSAGSFVTTLSLSRTNVIQAGGLYYDSISGAVTAAGTTQGTATALTNTVNNITTVAASTGVVLPVPVQAGARLLIRNGGANILRIYPQASAQINTLGTNVPLQLETGALIEFVAFTTAQWYTVNATFA